MQRLQQWLRERFPPEPVPHSTLAERAALAAFEAAHPRMATGTTRLLAEETSRFVVAVYYGSVRPSRYAIVAVPKADLLAVELEEDETRPYWFAPRR